MAACRGRRFGLAMLVIVGVAIPGCSEIEETETPKPVEVEDIPGTDVKRVTLQADAARRVGLETAAVLEEAGTKVIPIAAVIYDPAGGAWAYTSPEPLVFVRKKVRVDDVEGARARLSKGPRAGTEVVTTGAAEVYGTEFEVDH
jgi:hypothetical protein